MAVSATTCDLDKQCSDQMSERLVWESAVKSAKRLVEEQLSKEQQLPVWRSLSVCIKQLEKDCDRTVYNVNQVASQLKLLFSAIHECYAEISAQKRTAEAQRDGLAHFMANLKAEEESLKSEITAIDQSCAREAEDAADFGDKQIVLAIFTLGFSILPSLAHNEKKSLSILQGYNRRKKRLLSRQTAVLLQKLQFSVETFDFELQIVQYQKQLKSLEMVIGLCGQLISLIGNAQYKYKNLIDRYSWLAIDIENLKESAKNGNHMLIELFCLEVQDCYEQRKPDLVAEQGQSGS